jgi:hypothetical protein
MSLFAFEEDWEYVNCEWRLRTVPTFAEKVISVVVTVLVVAIALGVIGTILWG